MRKTISIEGCDVVVRVTGSGLPIVLISGGPGLACDYLSPLAALSDRHQIILFDQPGCGESVSSVPPTANQTVDATIAVIRSFAGAGPFALAAHSWGAYLAAQACLQLANAPAATILFNPVPFDRQGFDTVGARLVGRVEPDILQRIGELSSLGTADAGRELMRLAMPAYCGRTHDLPDVTLDFNIATSNAVTASLGNYNVRSAFSCMGDLTLVFGRTDYILASDFEGQATNAKRVTLESGHFSILDSPAEVESLITDGIGS